MQGLPHFTKPFICLSGYFFGGGGTFDFISKSLKFVCLLKAVRGGSLKHYSKCLSWRTIDLQCLAMIGCRAGNLGSYLVANIGLFSVIFFFTFIKATFLGIFLALLMAVSTISWLKKLVPSPLTPKNYILLVICGAPKRITMLRKLYFMKFFLLIFCTWSKNGQSNLKQIKYFLVKYI